MQGVVQALSEVEELLVCGQDKPAGVDTLTTDVREKPPEHFRHSAARRRGIYVPENTTRQAIADSAPGYLDLVHPRLTDEWREHAYASGVEFDFGDGH